MLSKRFFLLRKRMKNQIIFYIVLILTLAVSFFERSSFQIGLLIALFISIGFLIKRKVLFAGIAIVVISFVFVVKNNFNINSGNPKIKKFNFSIGEDEK